MSSSPQAEHNSVNREGVATPTLNTYNTQLLGKLFNTFIFCLFFYLNVYMKVHFVCMMFLQDMCKHITFVWILVSDYLVWYVCEDLGCWDFVVKAVIPYHAVNMN